MISSWVKGLINVLSDTSTKVYFERKHTLQRKFLILQLNCIMSLSMPPPTDSIVPQTVEAGHIITENKSNNALDYVHNDQLESLRYSSNEEDTEYPEGGTSAWLLELGSW